MEDAMREDCDEDSIMQVGSLKYAFQMEMTGAERVSDIECASVDSM